MSDDSAQPARGITGTNLFSHITLGVESLETSAVLYRDALGPLGFEVVPGAEFVRVSHPQHDYPWVSLCKPFDDRPAARANGFHIAFEAKQTSEVDAFFESAIRAGATDDGPPGPRPQYKNGYYGAYVRDFDGNKLQVVCYTEAPEGQAPGLMSHITIGTDDPVAASSFYTPVLGELGIAAVPAESGDSAVAFGPAPRSGALIYVYKPFDGQPATAGNGTHVALHAQSRNAVDKFYATALDNGGRCEGPPGPRPHYGDNYYAAYVRDPLGNKLQAVCRTQS